jgi:hypothetical protein
MAGIVDISELLLEVGLGSSATNEERALANSAITKAQGAIIRHLGYNPAYGTRTEILGRRHRSGLREVTEDIAGDRAVLVDDTNYGVALQLRHLPVRSITHLYVDYNAKNGAAVGGAFGADTEMESGTDFWFNAESVDSSGDYVCMDGLVWSSGAWAAEPGTIKIVYVAGYTASELHGQDSVIDASPIWDACLDEAVRRLVKSFTVRKHSRAGWTSGTIASESLGDYSVSFAGTSGGGSAGDRRTGGTMDLLPETIQKLSEFVNWGVRLSGGM